MLDDLTTFADKCEFNLDVDMRAMLIVVISLKEWKINCSSHCENGIHVISVLFFLSSFARAREEHDYKTQIFACQTIALLVKVFVVRSISRDAL